MKIIAKTEDGYLINATKNEVSDILRAVFGECPDPIKMDQKIPAFDYAATVTKIKELRADYAFRQLLATAENFNQVLTKLETTIENVSTIEI